jgi:hypothetical protein
MDIEDHAKDSTLLMFKSYRTKINQFPQPKNSQLHQLIPPNKLLHVFSNTFFYQTIMQNGDNQMHFPIIVTHDRKLVQ